MTWAAWVAIALLLLLIWMAWRNRHEVPICRCGHEMACHEPLELHPCGPCFEVGHDCPRFELAGFQDRRQLQPGQALLRCPTCRKFVSPREVHAGIGGHVVMNCCDNQALTRVGFGTSWLAAKKQVLEDWRKFPTVRGGPT